MASLIIPRIGGQDWQFANVTANNSYKFVGPRTTGVNLTEAAGHKTFELRGITSGSSIFNIANYRSDKLGLWICYLILAPSMLTSGTVQLTGVAVDRGAALYKVKPFPKMVEVIGDSCVSV